MSHPDDNDPDVIVEPGPPPRDDIGEVIRLKWLRRKRLLAQIDATKANHKLWLLEQPQHVEYEAQLKSLKEQVQGVEYSIDQAAALGTQQGDFLVDMDREDG